MTVDVLVVGAGPAGSAAATVLAGCGHRTVLVDRPASGRPALAESIPPSANRILTELGMKNAVDAAGFHPWLGNTVWWGSDEARIEPFAAGELGYQVERARFDAVLRDVAARAGAQIVSGTVRDVDLALETQRELRTDHLALENQRELRTAYVARPDPHPSARSGWPEPVEGQGRDSDPQRVTAKIILDCSGRAGVIARKGLRQPEASHRTIALIGVWSPKVPWSAEQRGHTLVASYADGWAWSVPTAADIRYVTVMVDPERSHLSRGVSALDVYLAELKKVSAFVPLLEHATLVSGPWGADASLYSTSQHSGPGFLLVGDAASFIDPLSSFGVKKALASGWLAAITANTILKTPAMAGEARAFYERRERAVVESFRQQTARYAADAIDALGHPFWEARVDQSVARPSSQGRDHPASEDGALLAALADLRARPDIHLRRSAHVRTAPKAAIRGNLIVMEDHLFIPEWPDGVRYLRNIDLLLLSQLAPEHRDVGALYDALFRVQPGVSLPDFLGVLSTLIARGALHHEM